MENVEEVAHDHLSVAGDKYVLELVRRTARLAGSNGTKDKVVFSDFVLKYNKYTRSQKRAIVISTSCLFNYSPKGDGVGKCKRVVPLKSIEQITSTEHGQELIIHIPSEYDIFIRTPRKDELIALLDKQIQAMSKVSTSFHYVLPVANLEKFVLTKKEARKGMHVVKAPRPKFNVPDSSKAQPEPDRKGSALSEEMEVEREAAAAEKTDESDEDEESHKVKADNKGELPKRARKESTFFGFQLDSALLYRPKEGSENEKELNPEALFAHFLRRGRVSVNDAKDIIMRALVILREEPNIVEVESPVTVTGDIHAQFFDLQNTFALGGEPERKKYIFLGDYVDRGKFGTEVMLYLFALKAVRPLDIVLLRGNHEARKVTRWYNFKDECLLKYNSEIYDLFMDSFDCLPLAAIVDKKFFCVHGGISPHGLKLSEIYRADRFCEPPDTGLMTDLLWSDPEDERPILDHYDHVDILDLDKVRNMIKIRRSQSIDNANLPSAALDADDKGLNAEQSSADLVGRPRARSFWMSGSATKCSSELGEGFQKNSKRGCSVTYGFDAVKKFLVDNDLKCIIRAHEVEPEG